MSIFSRLTDIINSNITSILDRAEDPAKIIRLIIQEMEDTLVEVRSGAARNIADKKEVERKLAKLIDAQSEWERRAEIALTKGREDLAKGALLEKAKLAEAIEVMKEDLEHIEEALQRGDEDIAKLQAKLAEAKAKQKGMVTRHDSAASRLKVRQTLYDGRVDDALGRFEQLEKKLDEAEGRVEAFDVGQRKTLAQEIVELEVEDEIDAEMAAIKDRLAKKSVKKKG
ncbi:phage shock protein PspA [Denitrobaculum tricleocarpae]|uniref:Phage shock protein PspA n=1 Tax=Denitrobaculum tricleocarpae TaxID=2591009 RepID=A0A545TMH4_9PROT|nr:phage shock protein PspA [Denitrobaculum tricleocarpae]TQV78368.1 phage shock protein PspA [Denitrobaculum tricleocarpae]